MELVIRPVDEDNAGELADDLIPELETPMIKMRRLSARRPGVASEPVTTAIGMIVLGKVTANVVDEVWPVLAGWVRRTGKSIRLSRRASEGESVHSEVTVDPELAQQPKPPPEVVRLLSDQAA